MRGLPYGHTRFIQENGQAFISGEQIKPCSVSISGGGDIHDRKLINREFFPI